MSSTTVVAQLVTADGANCRSYFSHAPEHMWNPVRRKVWVIPSVEIRSIQPSEIPLRLAHGQPPVGRIVHLERRASDQSLWAVGEITEDIRPDPDTDYYLSVEAVFDEGTIGRDIEIRGAAICERSAMHGLWPAVFIRSGLDQRGQAVWRLGRFQQDLLEHAAAARRRRWGEPILVRDSTPAHADRGLDQAPAGQLEFRSATPLGVSGHGRTVELIVMPYEQETIVAHHGRMVREVCSRGAFAGIEKRGKIPVNRDHQVERTCGKATSFDPHDPRGLVAQLRISRTTLGDETLALAEDGVLDASAGFMVEANGEQWEQGRSRRRLNKVFLHHIALTPDAAYEGANVLAVRTTSSRTPNLDRVLAGR